MSKNVREFFPETPEKCLECPGLLRAASVLENVLGFAGTAAGLAADSLLEDPMFLSREEAARLRLSEMATSAALHDVAAIQDTARALASACETGVVKVVHTDQDRRRIKRSSDFLHVSSVCGSRSITAQFVPIIVERVRRRNIDKV